MKPDAQALAEVWIHYRATQDDDARRTLIEAYTPLVETLAAMVYRRRVNNALSYHDMLHYGMVGLLEALAHYRPNQGADFKTYAGYRIKGEIYDGLAQATEVSSQIEANKARLRQRATSLSDGASPTDPLAKLIEQSIGLAIGFMLDETALFHDEQAVKAPQDTVYQAYELKELAQLFATLVAKLPKEQERVVRLHYFHHFQFSDIALMLNLSRGRVSQLHKAALSHLRRFYDSG